MVWFPVQTVLMYCCLYTTYHINSDALNVSSCKPVPVSQVFSVVSVGQSDGEYTYIQFPRPSHQNMTSRPEKGGRVPLVARWSCSPVQYYQG